MPPYHTTCTNGLGGLPVTTDPARTVTRGRMNGVGPDNRSALDERLRLLGVPFVRPLGRVPGFGPRNPMIFILTLTNLIVPVHNCALRSESRASPRGHHCSR
jgi:hypothetical protein